MKLRLPDAVRKRVVRPVPLGIFVALLTAILLIYRLFSHVPYGRIEEPHSLGFGTSEEILNNALYAPIKILGIIILKFSENDAYTRLASAAAALASAMLLYLMLRKWYTQRVSFLTIIMFITSSWFLHYGRLTNLEAMEMAAVPGVLLIYLWLLSKQHYSRLPFAALLLGLILYIPGAWLLAAGALIILRSHLLQVVGKLGNKIKVGSAAILLVTLLPLFYSFTRGQRQIVHWLGFDTQQSLSPVSLAGNIIAIPRELLMSGPDNAAFWLGGSPVFDVFSAVMIVLGIYAFYAGYYPTREKIVYAILAISVALISLGNVVGLGLIIPMLYIIIANGLAYMLQSWFTVFPRNPVARSSGIVLLCAVIALSSFYQLHRYFDAWPKHPQTRSALTSEQ